MEKGEGGGITRGKPCDSLRTWKDYAGGTGCGSYVDSWRSRALSPAGEIAAPLGCFAVTAAVVTACAHCLRPPLSLQSPPLLLALAAPPTLGSLVWASVAVQAHPGLPVPAG